MRLPPNVRYAPSDMTNSTETERSAAAALAERLEIAMIDPSIDRDEFDRPPSDRSPAHAQWLTSAKPPAIERNADLSATDWQLISRALEHYTTCENASKAR
jgi:hypothetical protein